MSIEFLIKILFLVGYVTSVTLMVSNLLSFITLKNILDGKRFYSDDI